jgi:flagellum-specific ATP synthase
VSTVHPLVRDIAAVELVGRVGRVVAVRGTLVESTGPACRIGERCRIESATGTAVEAEVIGFDRGVTLLMPYRAIEGLSVGERVVALGELPMVPVGRALLGRVIDPFGMPVDGKGPVDVDTRRSLQSPPLPALRRARVREPLETGIRVIDAMLPLAKGQRIGLFAGGGVGKSTLLGMLARGTQATVNVVALIGERSREVREFVEDQLGAEGLQRSVVVVATGAEPAVLRVKAAQAAASIAEHFRDEGEDVLLMMDSLTRFAMARREIGLVVGEPPTARGYTPSVFTELPQLCERAGPGLGSGSITAVYTVLVEGDDMNEPVADTLRATLDGHIVLSRELAHGGQLPAVDVLNSVSRLHGAVAKADELAAARALGASCALYERNRPLIEIGAHQRGVNPALDRALLQQPQIRAFFSQAPAERSTRAEALAQLRRLSTSHGVDDEPRR